MSYAITFEDGSSAYLEHHGVKGMHWGVRNAETQARYAGGKGGQRRYRLAARGDKYSQAVTNQRRAYNAKQGRAKQAAKVALLGVSGSRAYNTSRSRGLSRSESLVNARGGEFYIQGVKSKQRKAGTTNVKISDSAKKRSAYANSQSTGKQVAKIMLGGPLGATQYNTIRSQNGDRGEAAVHAVIGAYSGVPVAQYTSYERSKRK